MVLRRPGAHISKEVFEGIPAFTHLNTSSAIMLVTNMLRILAALMHHLPDAVLLVINGRRPLTLTSTVPLRRVGVK